MGSSLVPVVYLPLCLLDQHYHDLPHFLVSNIGSYCRMDFVKRYMHREKIYSGNEGLLEARDSLTYGFAQ